MVSGLLRRRWVLLMLVAGALWLTHRPLLRAAAGWLVVDQPTGDPDFVWLGGADLVALDAGARLYRAAPRRRVVWVAECPSRLVRSGVLEPTETIIRRELPRRGVPLESLEILQPPAAGGREALARLGGYLAHRPGTLLAMPCHRLWSARQRRFLDDLLEPAVANRIRVLAVSDGVHDETNWWYDRSGVREFMYASISRIYSFLGAARDRDWPEWDPDEYERTLAASLTPDT